MLLEIKSKHVDIYCKKIFFYKKILIIVLGIKAGTRS